MIIDVRTSGAGIYRTHTSRDIDLDIGYVTRMLKTKRLYSYAAAVCFSCCFQASTAFLT